MQTRSFDEDIESLLGTAAEELRARWRVASSRREPTDVVRFGVELELEFHELVVLLLKSEWQRAIATLPTAGATVDTRLLEKRFAPDGAPLFAALAAGGLVPNAFVFDERSLQDLLREMVALELHLAALRGRETGAFVERQTAAVAMLRGQPPEVAAALTDAKRDWLMLLEELGDRLLYLEHRRLDRENVMQRWAQAFGADYVALVEQSIRIARLQRLIDLKLAAPASTRAALEARAAESEDREVAELRRLRYRLGIVGRRAANAERVPISSEALAAYRRNSKRVLREIWLLIHPDKLAQNPRFRELTAAQKDLLDSLWSRAMTVRAEELGFEDDEVGYEHRSLVVLEEILGNVRDVLANAGIDTDVNLVPKGDTPEAQLQWLRAASQRLRVELDHVQAELLALLNDDETRQRAALLAAGAEQKTRFLEATRAEARKLAERAARMEQYLEGLFGDEERLS